MDYAEYSREMPEEYAKNYVRGPERRYANEPCFCGCGQPLKRYFEVGLRPDCWPNNDPVRRAELAAAARQWSHKWVKRTEDLCAAADAKVLAERLANANGWPEDRYPRPGKTRYCFCGCKTEIPWYSLTGYAAKCHKDLPHIKALKAERRAERLARVKYLEDRMDRSALFQQLLLQRQGVDIRTLPPGKYAVFEDVVAAWAWFQLGQPLPEGGLPGVRWVDTSKPNDGVCGCGVKIRADNTRGVCRVCYSKTDEYRAENAARNAARRKKKSSPT